MSDNRRVYRTIEQAIMQLYPGEPKGNTARMLTTLAAMVSGIVLGKSCQLPTIARKAPDTATATSTPTPTSTPTLTTSPTPLLSLTRMPIPSLTQTIGLTQSLTPPQIQQTPTVYDRPYPGGEGNRRVAGWLAGIASALTLIGMAGLALSWRLPSRG